MWLSDLQKIGAVFLTGGVVCFFLGVISSFDARSSSFGNSSLIVGLVSICGVPRTVGYFTARNKRLGSMCFISGVAFISRKWPFTGFCLESFGLLNSFADFSGVIIAFSRQSPIIGSISNSPAISPFVERFATGNISPI